MRHLELDDNSLETAGLLKIAEALESRTVDLLSLQITSNAVGDAGVEALAEFLSRSNALRTLKLGGNGLTDTAAATLADVIPPSLHELDLSYNTIGDSGLISLLHACADTLVRSEGRCARFARPRRALRCCGYRPCPHAPTPTPPPPAVAACASQLREIELDNNAITSRGARDAADLLHESNDKLRELDLKGNAIDADAVAALFALGDKRRAAGRTIKVRLIGCALWRCILVAGATALRLYLSPNLCRFLSRPRLPCPATPWRRAAARRKRAPPRRWAAAVWLPRAGTRSRCARGWQTCTPRSKSTATPLSTAPSTAPCS